MSKQLLDELRPVSNNRNLVAWLEAQRDEHVRVLTQATELVAVHRAQGAHGMVTKLLDLLEKANNLR